MASGLSSDKGHESRARSSQVSSRLSPDPLSPTFAIVWIISQPQVLVGSKYRIPRIGRGWAFIWAGLRYPEVRPNSSLCVAQYGNKRFRWD